MKWDPREQKWVDEYAPMTPGGPKKREPGQLFVRIGVPIVAAALILTAGSRWLAGEGSDPGAPASPGYRPTEATGRTPLPAQTTSPYDEYEVERGSARAAVQVVATEPDPEVGQPRIAAQFTQTEMVTGCDFVHFEIITYPTKRLARAAAQGSKQGAAWARVEFAEKDWVDKFVVTVVDVVCP